MKFNRINKLIEVLRELSTASGPRKTYDLALCADTSVADLQQSLCRLVKAGIIGVKRGPGGGFIPGSPLTAITYLDLMRALRMRNVNDPTVVKLFSQPIV